jgi:rfaE bifunctional protein nucleotidyltransferase chain/domain
MSNCVLTNGCFDLLHVGHINMLERCRELANEIKGIVVVGVNSDLSVRLLKGPGRPTLPYADRAKLLLSTRYVDNVFMFTNEQELLMYATMFRPRYYLQGDEQRAFQTITQSILDSWKGTYVTVPIITSTTNIINAIKAS